MTARIWAHRLVRRALLGFRNGLVRTIVGAVDRLLRRIHPDAVAAEKARWHTRVIADLPAVVDQRLLDELRELHEDYPSGRNVARFLEACRRVEAATS